MTDIKEAQGLEVVAWLNTSSSEATTYTPTVMDWDDEHEPVESLCRLSDATAVIDQLRVERDAARESMYALDELTDKQSDLINTQIKRVAELEADVSKWKSLAEASQTIAEIAQNSTSRMDALKSSTVVMPERMDEHAPTVEQYLFRNGWNECLDEFESLNRSKT